MNKQDHVLVGILALSCAGATYLALPNLPWFFPAILVLTGVFKILGVAVPTTPRNRESPLPYSWAFRAAILLLTAAAILFGATFALQGISSLLAAALLVALVGAALGLYAETRYVLDWIRSSSDRSQDDRKE